MMCRNHFLRRKKKTYSFQVGLTRPDSTCRNDAVSGIISSSTLCRKPRRAKAQANAQTMNTHRPARALSRAISRAISHSSFSSSSLQQQSSTFPLKNVTKSNFEPALADLRRHVAAADFVAIDLEMTGITSAPWRDSLEFDRADVCYLKVKDSAEKFAVLQFGVCPFRWDSSKRSFIAHPHNFYIFPRQELPLAGPAFEFLCQTTSIDFLAKYQFDFNVCIHEGISYLSREQESEALRRLSLAYDDELLARCSNLKEHTHLPVVKMADTLFAERMKNSFTEWRDGLLRSSKGGFQFQGDSNDSQQLQTIFFKMRPALSLRGFTSHQLRLIQMVIMRHFQDLSYVQINGEKSCQQQLVVRTESKDDRELLLKEVKDEHRREAEVKVQAAVGFRHVIDLLSSEQKLIVGHNCFLDIAHVYSKFLGPLPSTAEEFVSTVNKYFPHVIDTKVLLNTDDVLQQRMKKSRTSLSSAFALLCPQIALGKKSTDSEVQMSVNVEVQVDDLRSSNWNSGAKHEAGYDAFMTGCVFAQTCSHLGIDFQACSSSEKLAHNEKLQKQINHLYLSWSNGDIIDLTTGKKNAMSSGSNNHKKRYLQIMSENIALIWGFPSKLKARDVRECISKVFGPTSVTSVFHLDETAVFVQFSKETFVSEFLALKETLERSDGPVSVLHPLAGLLEGGSARAANYETYKEICSSPSAKGFFTDQAEAVGVKWKTKLVESKEASETLKRESFDEKSEVNPASKTEHLRSTTDTAENDPFCGRRSQYKIIDTLIASEGDRMRTN
ncbi:poly(A)-specific ribonuclease PARN-like isoform X1 [Malus sylvestris]|uniref:poly(A)-specific ribonuclease PARN-like isoform X1 n=1 Tax=Malus sylvestris TaxID=3752 RepID=UPI0021ABD15C|nr:poly(A)-specific ribonuclease PARN-like isoform X1 [Malus sylvestris]XP_050140246.1 poly(A)-specific ribonuclease PARN-like isoform X1 [Malus sylvestris]